MLIQFSCQNFKCFKDEIKLSLIASNYDKATREDENIIDVNKFGLRLLKSAVVYGANASGKTKLIDSMAFMRSFILSSSKEGQIDEPIDVTPFLLNSETEHAPSIFEIIFVHKNEMYRYGFEVDKVQVLSEWLYHKPKTKETEIFYREEQEFSINKRKFDVSDIVERSRVRPNALLLSVAANFNDKFAIKVLDWFRDFNIISGIDEEGYEGFSMRRIDNAKGKISALDLMKSADLDMENWSIEMTALDNLPVEFPDALKDLIKKNNKDNLKIEILSDVKTYHKKFNNKNLAEDLVEFSMEKDESEGTKKYFAFSGPILETLQNGEILVVDELANKLHPNLVCKLVEIFNSKEKNPNNAQLIFNTHDTNLLSSGLFRRDQIWFMEKDRYGASSLYSLGDFKTDTVRKEDNFEKNYIKGKYGAIPYLGDFDKLFAL